MLRKACLEAVEVGSIRWEGLLSGGLVEMPVNWSARLFVMCCLCVSAIDNKPKPVVFSYASSGSHPHVATLSHHYRAPPEPQQYPPPSGGHSQQYVHPSAVQNGILPHTGNVPHPSPPPMEPQEAYPQHFNHHGSSLHGDRNYDNHNPDIYQPPVGSPTPYYDHTTISNHGYESSTVSYHNHQPVDNHNYYRPNYPSQPPVDNDHRFYDQSTVPPDLGFQTTPVYYNDRPPDNIPNIQPPYNDHPQAYDHPSAGFPFPTQQYNDDLVRHSQPLQQNHDHSTPLLNGPTDSTVYNSPQHPSENPLPASNSTFPSQNSQYNADGSLNQNFPDYQAPASPEYFGHSSQHPPRGDKTFSPLPPSSTEAYYEDDVEYTTPVIEFESVKQKLSSIEDYPPPRPGYITKPFESSFNQRKKIDRQELHTGKPSKVLEKSSRVHYSNDKVLQKPKFFAYSTDISHEYDGGTVNEEELSDENVEGDHEKKKKKDEKYTKGGGQEHHSGHKGATGDKGEKGYKSEHKHEEGKKGHHEKEDHKGKYVDEKGKKGKKEEEGGHYGEHHKAEKGEKATKFGESGEHKKGHSTKGEHNIHKVDEYLKKHEFYDEHHEGGDHEKFGGFMEAHARKKGGKKKKGHHKGGHHHKHKGKKGHHEKGHKLGQHKGHKDAKGYDGHFSNHKKYGKKGGSKKGKNWSYSKGKPPK